MKRPLSRKAEAANTAKLTALTRLLDSTSGPMDAASLARSYGITEPDIIKILTRRGRLQHGKSTVSV